MKGLNALAIALQAREPVLTIGGPGIGKSTIMRALIEAVGGYGETVIASLREPSDFGGLPIIGADNLVHLSPPAWAVNLARVCKEGKLAVGFIDEISTAAPATQAALLRVIQECVVGDLCLNTDTNRVAFVAAMNPANQSAGGWELAPPLANRFCHIEWSVDTIAWIDGMLQGWPSLRVPKLPATWHERIPHNRALVASFIKVNPGKLYVYPAKEADAGKPWPSPRSWDMTARLLSACESAGADAEAEAILTIGCIGTGIGLEFLNWRKELDLPDPEMLIANPEKFELPERGDKAFTVLTSVAIAVSNNMTKTRYIAAWQIFNIAASKGQKDIAAASVRMLAISGRKKDYLSDDKVKEVMTEYIKPFTDILTQAGIV